MSHKVQRLREHIQAMRNFEKLVMANSIATISSVNEVGKAQRDFMTRTPYG